MPLRPCLGYRGERCARLTDDPSTRCPDHKRKQEATRRPNRPSARQRGYDAEYEASRAIVLARSRICWRCGHEGADQADHVVHRSRGGSNAVANLRPSHGTEPCQVCGRRCNQQRGDAA